MILFSSQFCGLVIRVEFSCARCGLLTVCGLSWAAGLALQEALSPPAGRRVSRQQQVGRSPVVDAAQPEAWTQPGPAPLPDPCALQRTPFCMCPRQQARLDDSADETLPGERWAQADTKACVQVCREAGAAGQGAGAAPHLPGAPKRGFLGPSLCGSRVRVSALGLKGCGFHSVQGRILVAGWIPGPGLPSMFLSPSLLPVQSL